MQDFAFGKAGTAQAAVQTASTRPATYIAGGTSLIDLMKEGVERPDALVDINGLPLGAIAPHGEGLRLGALASNTDVARHPLVIARYPMLSEALLSGASPQLRNMATVGGNLLQRTRCPYFRDVQFERCNKRVAGSGCGAREGHHRSNAILGGSEQCIATHASDMCVALVALDAVIHVLGPRGERDIPIRSFYLQPGDRPEREHVLAQGELITHVDLPAWPAGKGSRYLKVRDRASYEFALASAAVGIELSQGRIRSVRLALGGVGTVPWRATKAEKLLAGSEPTAANFKRAADAELAQAHPLRENAYKVELARRTIVRALEMVTGGSES